MDLLTPDILYLSQGEVAACGLELPELIAKLEEAFVHKGHGRVELPPKPGVHPRPDSFIHAMPAFIGGQDLVGLKWVSGYPENQKRNLPYISGLFILNDASSGLPVAVMDAAWMTAWRTAAVSAITAKRLARKGATRLAVLGLGVQGRTNLLALSLALPDLREVSLYDISPAAAKKYLTEMAPKLPGARLNLAASAREAVNGADVVLTAGPINKPARPVIELDWLKPGCLGLPLDFDSYFAPSTFLVSDRLYTDDTAQIRYYQTHGYFPALPPRLVDLGELLTAQDAGRRNEDEIILGCNLGIALDDVVTASLLFRLAREKGMGTWLKR